MKKFNTAALAEYDDGRLAAALDQAIRNIILDCEDRPGLKTARKVALELAFVPRLIGNDRECDSCELTWSISLKAPKQERSGCVVAVYRDGVAAYAPNSIDNPDQLSLLDQQEDNETDAQGSD